MAERIHFKNVRILDGTGTGSFEGEVEIEGERITRVAKGETKKADGGQVIDGNGATLMPGLCDAHIHFSWNDQVRDIRVLQQREKILSVMKGGEFYRAPGATSRRWARSP